MSAPILITGVGKRVGLALAEHFLDRNIEVIGIYRSQRPSLQTLARKGATLYGCDFYDDDSLEQLMITLRDKYQSLRAIIHNASDWLPEANPLPALETLNRMMRVHVGAPYLINLELSALLSGHTQKAGDIIHITDYVADTGSKKHIAYAASKAALHNLTLSFANLLAPGVKVNSIAPALVMFNAHDSNSYRLKAISKALITKEGGVDEIIAAVNYLLDSDYITGRTLHVDGGRHLV
ncbi:MAG: dihydromonapterin reductase/dihydrofolate reductase [Motiliproteus sp.]|jgi:dihydromonapterin reductase/dihydrofolate reductase